MLPSLQALSLKPDVLSTDVFLLDEIIKNRQGLVESVNKEMRPVQGARQRAGKERGDPKAPKQRHISDVLEEAGRETDEPQRNLLVCPNPGCDQYAKTGEVEMETEDRAVCQACGTELQQFASEDSSARKLMDEEPEARVQRLHAERYDADEVRQFYTIALFEINPVNDPEVLIEANLRLRQSSFLLQKLDHNSHTHDIGFWLTDAEIQTATIWLRAACVQWARDGGSDVYKGSPVFWTIVLALESVAQREGGFAVKNEELREVVTMDGLHRLLGKFVGNKEKVAESENAATLAGSASGWVRRAQQIVEKNVYRLPRLDNLGDESEREGKMNVLNNLLIRSRAVEQGGLDAPVRNFDAPGLIKQYPPAPMI